MCMLQFDAGAKQGKSAIPTAKLKLHSSNPNYYRSDELYKLIPEILNPNGIVWYDVYIMRYNFDIHTCTFS